CRGPPAAGGRPAAGRRGPPAARGSAPAASRTRAARRERRAAGAGRPATTIQARAAEAPRRRHARRAEGPRIHLTPGRRAVSGAEAGLDDPLDAAEVAVAQGGLDLGPRREHRLERLGLAGADLDQDGAAGLEEARRVLDDA